MIVFAIPSEYIWQGCMICQSNFGRVIWYAKVTLVGRVTLAKPFPPASTMKFVTERYPTFRWEHKWSGIIQNITLKSMWTILLLLLLILTHFAITVFAHQRLTVVANLRNFGRPGLKSWQYHSSQVHSKYKQIKDKYLQWYLCHPIQIPPGMSVSHFVHQTM